ncbi:HAD hydrolase-like protein [Oscillatoria sp. FACHB-1407]|uniref:HAD hydrolase-like protein n=1 Tax=Oscillatoria sp. FACHB-1407 TaxID=2692847 RepID=UPI0016828756|nr:HAD hydrolase-like protein [Oscillatoria sp. FACHB-1407]MBD2459486.1 HAD hydrolase-like protein [Oscillatoria sp. FACHB-1407]
MGLLMVDMDGTLRMPLEGKPYFQHPQDQCIITGVDTALQAYKDNWTIVGITNDAGVALGYKSLHTCVEELQYTLQLVPELEEIYVCPDFNGRRCWRVTRQSVHNHSQTRWFRQYSIPQPGLLKLAMVRHNQLPEDCLYVGDRPEDEEAARRAEVSFQWAWAWIARHQAEAAFKLR